MNFPAGTAGDVAIGRPILKIGATGATPTAEVGFIGDTVTLELNREVVDLRQGNPSLLAERFVGAESVMLKFGSLEPLNVLTLLPRAMGAGVTASDASLLTETFRLGGDPAVNKFAVLVELALPGSITLTVRMWRAVGGGSKSVEMASGAFMELPHEWEAVASSTNWAGTALATNSKLVEIEVDTG